jgi:Xaa-Pro aminopeptidase
MIPILNNPFVTVQELKNRHSKVIAKMNQNSLLVLFSSQLQNRNADVESYFRQDSNFWYLTGWNNSQSILVIKKTEFEQEIYLFIPKNESKNTIWNGQYPSVDEAIAITSIKKIRFQSEFMSDFEKLLNGVETVYFDPINNNYSNLHSQISQIIFDTKRRSKNENLTQIIKPNQIMTPLRLYKSDWEIQQMRHSSKIAVNAHKQMKEIIEKSNWEWQLQNELYYNFGKYNTTWSYPAIVASGSNSTILHYNKNNQELKKNEMILVDSGCEYNYYASDITRCYPNLELSNAQNQVYQMVKKAQQQAIDELTKPNSTTLSVHEEAVKSITQSLINTKILTGSLEQNLEQKTYKKYFMHGTGHFLGLDVHDLGFYSNLQGQKSATKIEAGICLTVEPGIYFDKEDNQIPKDFRGIGVRIEDSLCVLNSTDEGNKIQNLTEELPK